jgi:hypothetical protein
MDGVMIATTTWGGASPIGATTMAAMRAGTSTPTATMTVATTVAMVTTVMIMTVAIVGVGTTTAIELIQIGR